MGIFVRNFTRLLSDQKFQKFPCIAVISTKVVGGDFFLVHLVVWNVKTY